MRTELVWNEQPNGEDQPFTAVVSNPPYQIEKPIPAGSDNIQPPVANVFHHHQEVGLAIAHVTTMIYPAGRWIQKSGKGMAQFGDELMNHPHLTALYTYSGRGPKALFTEMKIHDGLSVVFTNGLAEPSETFSYNGFETQKPNGSILPLTAELAPLIEKVLSLCSSTVRDTFSPRTLYGIESTYVEHHPERVSDATESPLPPSHMDEPVRLLTNDKGGPTGRTRWYWVERTELNDTPLLHKYQAVIESGVKQSIVETKGMSWVAIAPNEAHGRVKASAAWFDTEEELQNFLRYVETPLIKRLVAESASNLSSFGVFTPHLDDYTDSNPLFSTNLPVDHKYHGLPLSERLFDHFLVTPAERERLNKTV